MPEAKTTGAGMPGRRFKPYPAYKDSGVEWLGEIPAHWEVKKLAWLTECLDGRRIPLNAEERGPMQGEYPYWGANSIVDYVDRWLFDEELVLLGEDGAPFFDRAKSVAFHVSGKIWVNNHAHVLRPRRVIQAAFLAHVLNCVDYRAFIYGSTRDKLTQGDMNSIPVQFPANPEQRAIAAFLERETAGIEALVAKKERLIELLQEQRTALITRAVTKGLDPNVPMKDSGVEWLGEIPAHWEVKPLKGLLVRNDSGVWGEDFDDEGILVLRSTEQTVEGHWNIQDPARRRLSKREATAAKLEIGDLVTTKSSGSEAHIGKTSMVDERLASLDCCFSNFMQRLRVDPTNDPRLVWYLLNSPSGREQLIYRSSTTTGLGNLNSGILGSVLVPHAAIEEQLAIAAFLERETAKIDALLAKVRDAIARLKELRTALISAAVTGKIDVQEEATA